jgi:hypothetical protein
MTAGGSVSVRDGSVLLTSSSDYIVNLSSSGTRTVGGARSGGTTYWWSWRRSDGWVTECVKRRSRQPLVLWQYREQNVWLALLLVATRH